LKAIFPIKANQDNYARSAEARIFDLVLVFRGLHHYAAHSFANFGIEGHWQIIALVWPWFGIPRNDPQLE
jgi:hypothetical protein